MSTTSSSQTFPGPGGRCSGDGDRRVQVAQLRLTRRGRVVVTLLLLAVLLAGFVVFSGWSAASGQAGADVPTRTVVVSEGDTLWEIADEVAEPGQIREVVHRIEKLNALPGPALVEGQVLAVPTA